MAAPKPRQGMLSPPPPAEVAAALGVDGLTIDWLAGDGSDRCYFRVHSSELKQTLVLMQLSGADAEALRADGYDWIKIAKSLESHGIFVPEVAATMPEHAALIIEDYGDRMLETAIYDLAEKGERQRIEELYQGCFDILGKFLEIPRSEGGPWCKRQFDTERYQWELRFFRQEYLDPVVKVNFTQDEENAFLKDIKALSDFLAEDADWFVHRDFHSRNLMLQDDQLAVIDFQDARLGPASYDLVSLAFDSYVPFSAEDRLDLLARGEDALASRCGKLVKTCIEERWRPMLLQRQLKAIGSFGFLTISKNRGDYLRYVPAALETLLTANVADDRWPYLSGPLLEKMAASLDQAVQKP